MAAQAKGSTQSKYAATFGEVAQVGRRWGHCTRMAEWGLGSKIHVVADGAEWIRLQSQEVFSDQGHFLCDFYHVSQYLCGAAASCSQAPEPWRKKQQEELKKRKSKQG